MGEKDTFLGKYRPKKILQKVGFQELFDASLFLRQIKSLELPSKREDFNYLHNTSQTSISSLHHFQICVESYIKKVAMRCEGSPLFAILTFETVFET